jgi:hypothetical protein
MAHGAPSNYTLVNWFVTKEKRPIVDLGTHLFSTIRLHWILTSTLAQCPISLQCS